MNWTFSKLIVITMLFSLIIGISCAPGQPSGEQEEQVQTDGKKAETSDWSHVSLDGAGASFPYPIYSQWAFYYEELTGLRINYQSVGSGAGISAIQQKTVDFGASDTPLTQDELEEYGLIQFPMIIGGVVPVINLAGIEAGQLRLTPDVLAALFMGGITNWKDSAIAEINPELTLPDLAVTVVHRADGSGTTWIFSSYMTAVSPEWEESIGTGKSLDWPVGIGANKNEGIAQNVTQVDGAIGYVEYAYALQNDLTYCLIQNRDGNFAEPTAEAFADAAANADWANAPGYYMLLVDQPGERTWPIVGASFILVYEEQEDREKAEGMLEFFDWCFTHGKDAALELDYVPIPDNVVQMIEKTWADNIASNGEKVWTM